MSLNPLRLIMLWLVWGFSSLSLAAPPNVVFIISDDVGYGDLGCYGATKVRTPHLDRLASQGCRFLDAHSTASVCTPTRFALLTGRYAWRVPNTGIARGDQSLLIEPGTKTIASIMKDAGYATGAIGKWHLGLGSPPKTDYNRPLRPGPRDLGFDYSFLIPATGDRVPCVFVENDQVVGYDPQDPIEVSFGKKIGNEPTGVDPGVSLKIQGGPGHKDSVINGIPRIGFMTGGAKARWVDEDIADVLAAKSVEFIEKHAEKPFFLYLSPHDIHEPMVPHPRFRGTSECGWRGDVIHQLDWTVGEVLKTLDRLKLTNNTLVIFTSDNGGAIKDTYEDGTNHLHALQSPNGRLRAAKGTLYEGGHRVPYIARWPGHVPSNQKSTQLMGHVDTLAMLAALTKQTLTEEEAPDSFDVLPILLHDQERLPVREHLVLQGNSANPLALRERDWVLIEKRQPNAAKPGPGSSKQASDSATQETQAPLVELYHLTDDLAQEHDLREAEGARVETMLKRLNQIREAKHSHTRGNKRSPSATSP